MFATAAHSEAYTARNQDRYAVIPHTSGIVLALADGAGGTSAGAEAAETFILWTKAHVSQATGLRDAAQWTDLLARVDRQLTFTNGQTTAVIVALFDTGLCGASVGDSAAWLIDDDNDALGDLTAAQSRKPLLGTGNATPVAFERSITSGTLLLASDGLIKYAPAHRIRELARLPDLHAVAKQLVDTVRLKSGALPDDVSALLCRRSSPRIHPTPRKRYTLSDDGDITESEVD